MIRGVNLKLVAICLMLLFIFQIAFPTVSFALTGGPSQPETTAFTPVGANELVDLSTGDFSYNIPLMTVPGPNGGYPINMGYKAGVTMEQEASWVGLGWDLNVGSVNRNLRGLPDDFKGQGDDKVEKTVSRTKNVMGSVKITATLDEVNKKSRVTGHETIKTKNSVIGSGPDWNFYCEPLPAVNCYYWKWKWLSTDYYDQVAGDLWFQTNGYNNVEFRGGVNYNFNTIEDFSSIQKTISIGANYGSRDGLGGNFSKSKSDQKNKWDILGFNASFGGGQGFNMGLNVARRACNNRLSVNLSSGLSFAKNAPIGDVIIPNDYETYIGRGEFGDATEMKYLGKYGGELAFSQAKYKTVSKTVKAYGYLNSTNTSDGSIQDFHQENQQAHYDYSPTLPLPVYDNDVYTVTGQGISGAFRAYRNDVGMLANNDNETKNTTISAGVDVGTSTTSSTHVGVDAAVGTGGSYSGPWRVNNKDEAGNIKDIQDELNFKNKDTDKPLYESFYFDFLGNSTVSDENKWDMIKKDNPILYDVAMNWRNKKDKLKIYKTITAPYGEVSKYAEQSIKSNVVNNRNVRASHIGYKTKKNMSFESNQNVDLYKHIYPEDENPLTPNTNAQKISYLKGEDNHIHEISVNNGGVNYVYGLPAYNLEKEEVYCSSDESATDKSSPAIVDVTANDASPANSNGLEQFYQSTKLGAYASTYLLTGTYSEDYVDLTGNGPTEDDLGYWCKFNYSKADDYFWRVPFNGANFIEGNFSDVSFKKSDDKASFSYGKKEQFYVNSIETKTHIAIFETSDKEDNRGASSRVQTSGTGLGAKTKKLDRIKLYSKNDPNYGDLTKMIPVKTVVFEYDYSQCKNTPNSSAPGKGKLTLRKVYFTHQNNDKGALIPYEFSYGGEENTAVSPSNPDYSYMNNIDRWGDYQTQPYSTNSREFPYTNQTLSESQKQFNAKAWNLTQISLPSGGKIKVEYEQDDYGYVQTKRATQMFKLLGFKKNEESGSITSDFGDDPNLYLHFQTNKNLTGLSQSELNQYKEGLTDLYFKAYVHLKKKKGEEANEFIEGWAKIDHTTNVRMISANQASIKILPSTYRKIFKNKSIHPIQKAAAQHLHQRGDLMPTANPIRNANIIINGPIHFYKNKNFWCDKIETSETHNGFDKISIIRLNNPDKKKAGGGHRVAAIKISNEGDWGNWNDTYGQKFEYTHVVGTDITSSGVADYEPIIGGEENSMKSPIDYNGVLEYRSLRGNTEMYVEKPYCEAYYPSPRVVYGKVTVKNLVPKNLDSGAEDVSNEGGITVNEYYTSKDYPVYEDASDKLNRKHSPPVIPLPIPFFSNRTDKDLRILSQGYVVELNDMSGKMKAVSTYDSKASKFEDNFATKVEYIYHDYVDKYNRKRLKNEVTVLTDDGIHRPGLVGQKHDFYTYNHENLNWNVHTGAGLSIGNTGSAIKYITPNVQLNRSLSQRRILVSNKVIYKTGLLKEVITKDGGKKTIATNIAYDAYTGEPIVQKVDNDWDKPIYTYNYSGHWKYPALKGKYNNYRARFEIYSKISANVFQVNGVKVSNLLQVGDKIKSDADVVAYVTAINDVNSTFTATKKDGTDPNYSSSEVVEVYESGYKNAQGAKVGKLVSLSNPLDFPSDGKLIYKFVSKLQQAIPGFISATNESWATYVDECKDSISYSFTGPANVYKTGLDTEQSLESIKLYWPLSLFTPYKDAEGGACAVNLRVINSELLNQLIGATSNDYLGAYDVMKTMSLDLSSFRTGNDGKYLIDFQATGTGLTSGSVNSTVTFTAEVWTDCEMDCNIEGILHAEAVQLSDIWTFNYQDAGNPYIDDAETTLLASALTQTNPVNPYAYKDKGRWMPKKSWVYQIDRKQTGTNGDNIKIDKDGEYNTFYRFKWNRADTYNQGKKWEWATKITKYSPYGYQLENEDQLGIKSSELYGYDNSLVTAVAGNAGYEEIAYDGFETNNFQNGSSKWKHNLQGHFTGEVSLTSSYAHTGEHSMFLGDNASDDVSVVQSNFTPIAGKEYYFSFWMFTKGSDGGTVQISQNGSVIQVKQKGETGLSNHFTMPSSYATTGTKEYKDHYKEIDGWTKVEGTFTPSTSSPLTLSFKFATTPGASGFTCIDDMRLCPNKSAIQTYVYNPNTLWLVATLDYNNYATFYQRDNEGKLTLVKKETNKGIVTVKSARENIVK